MRPLCKLYLWACRRFRRDRLSLSAYAWKKAQDSGDDSLRIRIDRIFMRLKGEQDHCRRQFERETRRD